MFQGPPPLVRVTPGRSLARAVLDNRVEPNSLALVVDHVSLTYSELLATAGRIARVLASAREDRSPRLGAVLASRSVADYVGVLGTLLSGAGYVPLNTKFPAARNALMLSACRATTLVTAKAALSDTYEILEDVTTERITIVVPDGSEEDITAATARHPKHRFVGAHALAAAPPLLDPPAVDEGSIAYVMFTSGTTGTPKGVMLSHANVLHHLDVMWRRYRLQATDRCSQAFDLTFDLSVFDMFVPWGQGASVHVIPASEQMAPSKFINREKLTVWFSVPSVAMMLRGLRLLKPGSLPTLRLSLFCGERLTKDVVEAWQAAAPSSILENLYGPTEATIACTLYRWDRETSPGACSAGSVPIGQPYEGLSAVVVDPTTLERTPFGEPGELCMRGPQLAIGYLDDPVRTAERFVAMPWDHGPENRWYRTGDIARFDERGDLIHLGRNDEQVKLRGFRVELGEIEARLREAAKTDFANVVAWPSNSPTHVVGFIAKSTEPIESIHERLRASLPDYMIPREIHSLEAMPLNSNGKTDKGALRRVLESREDGNTG